MTENVTSQKLKRRRTEKLMISSTSLLMKFVTNETVTSCPIIRVIASRLPLSCSAQEDPLGGIYGCKVVNPLSIVGRFPLRRATMLTSSSCVCEFYCDEHIDRYRHRKFHLSSNHWLGRFSLGTFTLRTLNKDVLA